MFSPFGDVELRAAVKESAIRQTAIMSAMLRTLFDAGIVTPEQFERTYQEALAFCDQEAARIADEYRAEFLKNNPGGTV